MELAAFLLLTVVLVLLLGQEKNAPQSARAAPPPSAARPATGGFDAQGCWTTLLLGGLVMALFGVIFLGLISG